MSSGSSSHHLRTFNTRPVSEPAEPFKILFCGSDEFSAASLKAVLEAEGKWYRWSLRGPRRSDAGVANTHQLNRTS